MFIKKLASKFMGVIAWHCDSSFVVLSHFYFYKQLKPTQHETLLLEAIYCNLLHGFYPLLLLFPTYNFKANLRSKTGPCLHTNMKHWQSKLSNPQLTSLLTYRASLVPSGGKHAPSSILHAMKCLYCQYVN